jgi:hypothetical protein
MKITIRARGRWARRLALGLALAAAAVPTAQAASEFPTHATSGPAAATWDQQPVANWNREPAAAEFPMWTVNWAEPALHGAPEFPPSQINWAEPSIDAPATPVSGPGFDYRDAGIGAAIALGAALLAATGFLVLRRNRRAAGLA